MFGKDFFLWCNFIIKMLQLFGQIFGSEEEKKVARESEERTGDGDAMHAC